MTLPEVSLYLSNVRSQFDFLFFRARVCVASFSLAGLDCFGHIVGRNPVHPFLRIKFTEKLSFRNRVIWDYRIRYVCHLSFGREASRSMLSWGRHVITRVSIGLFWLFRDPALESLQIDFISIHCSQKGILSQPFPSILPYGTHLIRSMSHQYDPAFSKAKEKMPLSLCLLVPVSFWDVEVLVPPFFRYNRPFKVEY